MVEFIRITFTWGMLPFTVLLGALFLYWLVVIVGGLGMEALDAIFPDIDVDPLDGIDASTGIFDRLISGMGVGTIPASILLSMVAIKLWLLGFVYQLYVVPLLPPETLAFGTWSGLFSWLLATCVMLLVALQLTAITARPLHAWFGVKTTHGHQHLVGRECTLLTNLTATGGQAEVKLEGVPVVLSVQSSTPDALTRGATARIVSYDAERDVYQVAPPPPATPSPREHV